MSSVGLSWFEKLGWIESLRGLRVFRRGRSEVGIFRGGLWAVVVAGGRVPAMAWRGSTVHWLSENGVGGFESGLLALEVCGAWSVDIEGSSAEFLEC